MCPDEHPLRFFLPGSHFVVAEEECPLSVATVLVRSLAKGDIDPRVLVRAFFLGIWNKWGWHGEAITYRFRNS